MVFVALLPFDVADLAGVDDAGADAPKIVGCFLVDLV